MSNTTNAVIEQRAAYFGTTVKPEVPLTNNTIVKTNSLFKLKGDLY